MHFIAASKGAEGAEQRCSDIVVVCCQHEGLENGAYRKQQPLLLHLFPFACFCDMPGSYRLFGHARGGTHVSAHSHPA
jgi:hypothetical protein